MAKRADSQRRSQARVSDWRMQVGSITEPWQRMHLVLDLLSIECSNGTGANPERVQDLADFGIAIFPAEIEHHLPNGILGFSQDVSRPQFEAARRVMTTLGGVRRWSVHRHGDPSVHLTDIEQCLAWIEATLRPIYKDTWQTNIEWVEYERRAVRGRNRLTRTPEQRQESGERGSIVGRAIDESLRLLMRCDHLAESWSLLERRRARLPTRGKKPDGLFVHLPPNITSEEQLDEHVGQRQKLRGGKLKGHWLEAAEAIERVQLEVRLWRSHLDAVRALLPDLAPWMDDQREPPVDRWTARTQVLLRQLGGFCNRRTSRDVPDAFDTAAFKSKARGLEDVVQRLRSVEGLPPTTPAWTSTSSSGAELDQAESPPASANELPSESARGAPLQPTPPMSIRQAAKFANMDQRTLRKSMCDGLVRFTRSSHKKWRFCLAEFPSDNREKIRNLPRSLPKAKNVDTR